jgi:hypothetical protein
MSTYHVLLLHYIQFLNCVDGIPDGLLVNAALLYRNFSHIKDATTAHIPRISEFIYYRTRIFVGITHFVSF